MIKNEIKQGTLASESGKYLENAVENYLCDLGIVSRRYSKWINTTEKIDSEGMLLKDVPYTNIYGGNGRGEFVLSVNNADDVRIECRLQNSSGSVDEKFPYLFETAKAFEESIVILVVEGDGYKKGAKEWLKAQAESIKYKQILVVSLKGFKDWAKDYCKKHVVSLDKSKLMITV